MCFRKEMAVPVANNDRSEDSPEVFDRPGMGIWLCMIHDKAINIFNLRHRLDVPSSHPRK